MMTTTIKQRVTVQPDGSVTVRSPQLRPGDEADVIVLLQGPDAPQLADRIRQLAKLGPNWDGYGADPVRAEIIEAAAQFVERWLAPRSGPTPIIAPTRTGEILFSWQSDAQDLELELMTPEMVEYSNLDIRSGKSETGIFNTMDDPHAPAPARFLALLDAFAPR